MNTVQQPLNLKSATVTITTPPFRTLLYISAGVIIIIVVSILLNKVRNKRKLSGTLCNTDADCCNSEIPDILGSSKCIKGKCVHPPLKNKTCPYSSEQVDDVVIWCPEKGRCVYPEKEDCN